MHSRRQVLTKAAGAASLGGGLWSALLKSTQAKSLEKLQVATSSTGFPYATAYIAKQAGFFEAEGLDVDIFDGGGGSNAVASLVGGSADIGIVGLRNMSQATTQGVDLRAIGTGMDGFSGALVVQSRLARDAGITTASSMKDKLALLKGKTIAVQDIGGSSGGFVRNLLVENGFKADSVTLIDMGSNAGQLASLKARRIDGFVNGSPIWEVAVSDGYGLDVILSSRDLPDLADMAYIVQAVRRDALASKSDVLRRYLTAIRRAQIMNRDEPEKAKKAYANFLAGLSSSEPLPSAVLDLMWTSNKGAIPAVLAISPRAVELARKFFEINPKLSDSDLVDNTLAKQVMASIG